MCEATEQEVTEIRSRLNNAEAIKSRKLFEIAKLKSQLAETDYKAIKYAEGWLTDKEYAPIKAERQALRDRINELEIELTQI